MAELRLGADAKHPNPGYMNLLQEMGYPFDKASSALMAVKNESLDAAIDWLDKNRDELDAALVLQQEHRPSLGPSVVSSAPSSAPTPEFDADVRADGLSRSKLEAERKAHADFKRQKQMQEERELLKKKEQDAKIVREKYAKEKAEKAAAAAARKNPAAAAVPKDAQPPAAAAAPKVASGNTAAVIQVRLPNRPAIVVQGLTAGSSLLELYARVDAECGRVDYVLTQPFPPPVTHFSREDKRTLGETGLAPRAALTVTDLASLGKVIQGVGNNNNPVFNALHEQPAHHDLPQAIAADIGVAHKYRGPGGVLCSICQSELEDEQDARTLKCGHVFHDECATEWINENKANVCPSCEQ